MSISWHTERRLISELLPWDSNPRVVLEKPFKDLQKSINKFGLAEPIVINLDNSVIGGHARLQALKAANITECDCYVPDRMLTEKEHGELCIRLNKNQSGIWDYNKLANVFDKDDLFEWGFDDTDLGLNSIDFEDNNDEGTQAKKECKEVVCPECGAKFKPNK